MSCTVPLNKCLSRISILVGYDAASLGSGFLMFQNGVKVLLVILKRIH